MITAINTSQQSISKANYTVQKQQSMSSGTFVSKATKTQHSNVSFGIKGSTLMTAGERIVYGGMGSVVVSIASLIADNVSLGYGALILGIVICLAGVITYGIGKWKRD